MSFLGDLFTNKQSTTSNQQGTSNTANNLFPWLQDSGFLNQFQQQYSPGNIANAQVGFNPYQTGAANNLSGAGANLQPAFGSATNLAQNGITPQSIQSFMSPYTQQVVDATQKQFDTQNGLQNSRDKSVAAQQGALTGSGYGNMRAQTQMAQQTAQAPVIAGLYNQGFQTAGNLAGQSAQTQLGGVNALGSLTNAGTGANSALGSLGNTFWGQQYQNAMTPFQLNNQAIQGFGGLGQLAGTNTQSTGTSTGTTTGTPSIGGIGAGLFGAYLSGGKADGGRVGYADGGSALPRYEGAGSEPKPFHHKVAEAFDHFLGMRKKASGRQVSALPRYDDGGAVGGPPSDSSYWDGMVNQANYNQGKMDSSPQQSMGQKIGGGLSKLGGDMGSMGMNPNALADSQKALAQFMQGMQRPAGMADGGDPWGATVDYAADQAGPTETEGDASYKPDYTNTGPLTDLGMRSNLGAPKESPFPRYTPMEETPRAAPASGGSGERPWYAGAKDVLGSLLPTFDTGVWKGDVASPQQRLGIALTQIGNGPFAGYGQAVMAQQDNRLKELAAQRAATELHGKLFGQTPDGRKTLEGLAAPGQRALVEAHTQAALAGTVENKIKIAEQEKANALELGREDQRLKWEQVLGLLRQEKAAEDAKRAAAGGGGGPTLGAGRYRIGPDGMPILVEPK